ncbi:MAG: Wzz/FepE/Etk N-terminal domain-containing protein, partial [Bacillota bacterium]
MNQEGNNGPDYYDEYEIDLREYIMLLWDNKFFIGGLVVLAVLISYVYSTNF